MVQKKQAETLDPAVLCQAYVALLRHAARRHAERPVRPGGIDFRTEVARAKTGCDRCGRGTGFVPSCPSHSHELPELNPACA